MNVLFQFSQTTGLCIPIGALDLMDSTLIAILVGGCIGIWSAYLLWGVLDAEAFEAKTNLAALERKASRLRQANEQIKAQIEAQLQAD